MASVREDEEKRNSVNVKAILTSAQHMAGPSHYSHPLRAQGRTGPLQNPSPVLCCECKHPTSCPPGQITSVCSLSSAPD